METFLPPDVLLDILVLLDFRTLLRCREASELIFRWLLLFIDANMYDPITGLYCIQNSDR